MSDNILAQRIAEDNKDLKAQVAQLQEANESLKVEHAAYAALGSVEEISEKLQNASQVVSASDNIVESYQNIVESYGSEHEIVERLEKLNIFQEENGTLDEVSEALSTSVPQLKELQDFVESHGSLSEVGHTLTRLAASAQTIEENASIVAQLRDFEAERGSLDQIGEALDKAGLILGDINEARTQAKFQEVAEKYGKSPEQLTGIMEKLNIASLDQVDEAFALIGINETKDDDKKDEDDQSDDEKKEDKDEDDKVDESFRPGRAQRLVSGGQFLRKSNINESNDQNVNESRQIFQKRSSTSRLANMIK